MSYFLQPDEAIELKLKCFDFALRLNPGSNDDTSTIKSAERIFKFVTETTDQPTSINTVDDQVLATEADDETLLKKIHERFQSIRKQESKS